jgi:hypothetical protein
LRQVLQFILATQATNSRDVLGDFATVVLYANAIALNNSVFHAVFK